MAALYILLADLTVLVHIAFVIFVMLGGLLVLRRTRWAWAHLPAALWGAWIELSGGICPLTPLEIRFRRMGGESGYESGFVEHYLLPLLYPEGLSRAVQAAAGLLVILVNVAVYWGVLRSRRRTGGGRKRSSGSACPGAAADERDDTPTASGDGIEPADRHRPGGPAPKELE